MISTEIRIAGIPSWGGLCCCGSSLSLHTFPCLSCIVQLCVEGQSHLCCWLSPLWISLPEAGSVGQSKVLIMGRLRVLWAVHQELDFMIFLGPFPAGNSLWSCAWEERDLNGICAKEILRLPEAHLDCSKYAFLPCFTRIILILKARSAKQNNTDNWQKDWRKNGEIGYLVLG